MKYAVVIEKLPRNYCAHVPDLPVCVTTGETLEETLTNMQEAIGAYIASSKSHGNPVPEPTTRVIELEVA